MTQLLEIISSGQCFYYVQSQVKVPCATVRLEVSSLSLSLSLSSPWLPFLMALTVACYMIQTIHINGFADWYQIWLLSLFLQLVAASPLLVLDSRSDHYSWSLLCSRWAIILQSGMLLFVCLFGVFFIYFGYNSFVAKRIFFLVTFWKFAGYYWISTGRICYWTWRFKFC